MKILYLDCFSGIGDMALGALLDAGAPLEAVEAQLERLGVGGYQLDVQRAMTLGISGVRARVSVSGSGPLAEGIVVGAPGGWVPGQRLHIQPAKGMGLLRASQGGHGDHPHRPHREIQALIRRAGLAPGVEARALAIFARLAEAEGAVHDMPPEDVEFHEVGSVDAIVDVVGVAAALDALGIDRVVVSPLPMSRGFVDCAHGRMPLPAPAVAELIRGVPVVPDERPGEWVTPTGAAIAVALADAFGPLPPMIPSAVGYGLGMRDGGPIPNALRAVVGESGGAGADERAVVVEANIDDMTPQLGGHVLKALLAAGALDAWLTPIQMKKDRPAVMVAAVCDGAQREAVVSCLLRESTTIGVRIREVERACLPRRREAVATPWGEVRVKISGHPGDWPTVTPEYDDCAAVAARAGVPLRLVQQEAVAAAAAAGLLQRGAPVKAAALEVPDAR